MPASAHDVPLYRPPGVDQERVAELAALSWPSLVAYCDLVRAGVPDRLLALVRRDLGR